MSKPKHDPTKSPVPLKEGESWGWKMYNQEQADHIRTAERLKEFQEKCKKLEERIKREEMDLLARIREQEKRLDNLIEVMNNHVMVHSHGTMK